MFSHNAFRLSHSSLSRHLQLVQKDTVYNKFICFKIQSQPQSETKFKYHCVVSFYRKSTQLLFFFNSHISHNRNSDVSEWQNLDFHLRIFFWVRFKVLIMDNKQIEFGFKINCTFSALFGFILCCLIWASLSTSNDAEIHFLLKKSGFQFSMVWGTFIILAVTGFQCFTVFVSLFDKTKWLMVSVNVSFPMWMCEVLKW